MDKERDYKEICHILQANGIGYPLYQQLAGDLVSQGYGNVKQLVAENAELKARQEKAVELKYHEGDYVYFISWLSGNVCEGEIIGWQEDSGYAIQTGDALISAYSFFDTLEAAEARLKELEETKQ